MKLVFHVSENGSEIKRKMNISGKNMIQRKINILKVLRILNIVRRNSEY